MIGEWDINLSAVAAAATVTLTIGGLLYQITTRLARLELKVDTMWDFVMRRALAEGVAKGIGTLNSPFLLVDEAKVWFEPLRDDLHKFYRERGFRLSDKEMFQAIEREFGARLLVDICIPHKLYAGACVLAAIEVAKEGVAIDSKTQ